MLFRSIEFFKQYENNLPEEKYIGELYFLAHRGTYTSQAKTKKLNRKCEFALREAEMLSVISNKIGCADYPESRLERLWKDVLFNQFHDIIPGSSIKEVYDEANKLYENVLAETQDIIVKSRGVFLTKEEGYRTLFNSLSWDRKVCINNKIVTLPACGYLTFSEVELQDEATGRTVVETVEENCILENEYLRVTFNGCGEITGVFDKEANREFTKGICNRFAMYKDVPTRNDAWDIDSMYVENPLELSGAAEISVYENMVSVKKMLNNSVLVQNISLEPGSRRIDFDTQIDWQENHKLLKVCFPVNIHVNEALHDIQFGYYARPNHFNRQFDKDRFEVCAHKWTALVQTNCGAAVINDCKYGVNVLDNSINLTLQKAAMAPDKSADKGQNSFRYALYVWNGSFAESRLVNEAYEFNVPVNVYEGYRGAMSGKSFFKIDSSNVIIDTVKLAEDGTGDIILRMFESMQASEDVELTVNLPFDKAYITDMMENRSEGTDVSVCRDFEKCKIKLSFGAFEVKTLRLSSN